MGCISLPSSLNAIIDITSYYRAILKMVILHDAMKTIQNGKKNVFLMTLKKNKNLFLFKKKQKNAFFWKKRRWVVFFNPGFSQPCMTPWTLEGVKASLTTRNYTFRSV